MANNRPVENSVWEDKSLCCKIHLSDQGLHVEECANLNVKKYKV